MTFEELNEEIKRYKHPPNYMFDAETLEPYGVLADRVKIMEEKVPEFYEGGDTFLDIGCNKGFWMFYLGNGFKNLIGYEMDGHQVEIAESIKNLHGFDNVEFRVGTFGKVPHDIRADTVYVGGTHHHIFEEDLRLGKPAMDFVFRLKKMAEKYLIIDGVMNYTDFAMQAIIKDYNIQPYDYEQYTLDNIKYFLDPEFEFVRSVWDGVGENSQHIGTGGRYATVFKRR
jgi:hypothetical protein